MTSSSTRVGLSSPSKTDALVLWVLVICSLDAPILGPLYTNSSRRKMILAYRAPCHFPQSNDRRLRLVTRSLRPEARSIKSLWSINIQMELSWSRLNFQRRTRLNLITGGLSAGADMRFSSALEFFSRESLILVNLDLAGRQQKLDRQ